MITGSFGSVVSINSMPHSPEQTALLTSPLLRATQLVANAAPQQSSRRKLSVTLSPLPFHHRSVSVSFDTPLSPSKISKSSRSNNNHLFQNLNLVTLDMSAKQQSQLDNALSENSDIEDSPQLLATSGGAEFGDQLVQSISNISLLSLSHQMSNNNDSQSTILMQESDSQSTINSSTISNPYIKQSNIQQQRPFFVQRKTSVLSSSRKSSFNSPAIQSSQFPNAPIRPTIRRPSSATHVQTQQSQLQQQHQYQQQLQQYNIPQLAVSSISKTHSGRQPIQIRRQTIDEPDSPPLDPTSLANSPSNFMLSQNSPPNSLKSNSAFTFNQLPRYTSATTNTTSTNIPSRPSSTRQQSLQNVYQNQSQLKILMSKYSEDNNFNTTQPIYPLTRENSISNSIGGRSPEFAPVSLTLPPMTPLVLSLPSEFTSRAASSAVFDDESAIEEDDCDDNESKVSTNKNDDEECNDQRSGIRNDSINEDIFGETIDD